MKIYELQKLFHSELDDIYGSSEVRSIFNLLSEHFLKIKRLQLALNPDLKIESPQIDSIFAALNDLKNHKPIQYVLGETEFYGLPFKVNPEVLIPRPETEELVDFILSSLKKSGSKEGELSILDIGTGSGCIAVSLAYHLPEAKIYALDVSNGALEMAKINAGLNNVDISFIEEDILEAEGLNEKMGDLTFDVIVSNPPYVRNSEKKQMKPNVLDFEPHLALFVEDDNPLLFYKANCEFALNYLKDGGSLLMEINEYLGVQMEELLSGFGFSSIELKKDIFGKDRIIKGIKASTN